MVGWRVALLAAGLVFNGCSGELEKDGMVCCLLYEVGCQGCGELMNMEVGSFSEEKPKNHEMRTIVDHMRLIIGATEQSLALKRRKQYLVGQMGKRTLIETYGPLFDAAKAEEKVRAERAKQLPRIDNVDSTPSDRIPTEYMWGVLDMLWCCMTHDGSNICMSCYIDDWRPMNVLPNGGNLDHLLPSELKDLAEATRAKWANMNTGHYFERYFDDMLQTYLLAFRAMDIEYRGINPDFDGVLTMRDTIMWPGGSRPWGKSAVQGYVEKLGESEKLELTKELEDENSLLSEKTEAEVAADLSGEPSDFESIFRKWSEFIHPNSTSKAAHTAAECHGCSRDGPPLRIRLPQGVEESAWFALDLLPGVWQEICNPISRKSHKNLENLGPAEESVLLTVRNPAFVAASRRAKKSGFNVTTRMGEACWTEKNAFRTRESCFPLAHLMTMAAKLEIES